MVHQAFGEDRPCRIAGTDEEHVVLSWRPWPRTLQQHEVNDLTGMPTDLPRVVVGVQQAADSWAAGRLFVWLNTGMSPSVWKCSHATPCGSVIQCFSLLA